MSYDKEAAEQFDATFPAKTKDYQASQETFYILSHSVLKSWCQPWMDFEVNMHRRLP